MLPAPDPDDPEQRLLTTAEAARAAHVTEALIRKWADRELIKSVGLEGGSPLYRELDVLTAERDTRRAPRAAHLADEAMDGLNSPTT